MRHHLAHYRSQEVRADAVTLRACQFKAARPPPGSKAHHHIQAHRTLFYGQVGVDAPAGQACCFLAPIFTPAPGPWLLPRGGIGGFHTDVSLQHSFSLNWVLPLYKLVLSWPETFASEALSVSGALFLNEGTPNFLPFYLQTEFLYFHQCGQQVRPAAVPVEEPGLGGGEHPDLDPRFLHLCQ